MTIHLANTDTERKGNFEITPGIEEERPLDDRLDIPQYDL